MFDANAAHIKIGEFFFAEVHIVDKQLGDMGISRRDIVLCSHVSNFDEGPLLNHQTKIWSSLDAEPNTYTHVKKSDDWAWLVYSGRPNGNGFISDHYKSKAKEFLGGEWIADVGDHLVNN